MLAGTFRQYAFDITPEVMRMPDGTPADLQVSRVGGKKPADRRWGAPSTAPHRTDPPTHTHTHPTHRCW